MSDAKIVVHIETFTDDSYVPSFTVKLSVKSADGVTPCIFVHQYVPKLPSGVSSYDFLSVAYYDELNSVPDYIKHKKEPCLVRLSEVTKGLPTQEEMEDFIATVEHDIQRLLTQVNTTKVSGQCVDAEITAGTISRVVTDDCENTVSTSTVNVESEQAPGVVKLTFNGSAI